jgi:hypothetical protein
MKAFNQVPWQICFLPIVLLIVAFMNRSTKVNVLERIVDQGFGQGTWREFIDTLRPELLFSAMCLGIGASAISRSFIEGEEAVPTSVIGFFASGCIAFFVAHFIRQARKKA